MAPAELQGDQSTLRTRCACPLRQMVCPDAGENRAPSREGQWYRESRVLVRRYCFRNPDIFRREHGDVHPYCFFEMRDPLVRHEGTGNLCVEPTAVCGGDAMMNLNAWYAVLAGMGLLWYECGHDFGVFCYRIGCGVGRAARGRAFELAPLRATTKMARTNTACSIPSSLFSAPSLTPKHSKNS